MNIFLKKQNRKLGKLQLELRNASTAARQDMLVARIETIIHECGLLTEEAHKVQSRARRTLSRLHWYKRDVTAALYRLLRTSDEGLFVSEIERALNYRWKRRTILECLEYAKSDRGWIELGPKSINGGLTGPAWFRKGRCKY